MGEEAGKIFVGGVHPNTSEDDFKGHFAQYGEVIDCVLMKEPATGRPRGFGFVTYKDPSCVDKVLENASNMVLNGKVVDPKRCTPRGPGARDGGGGGRGGGGGPGGAKSTARKVFIGGVGQATEEEIKEVLSTHGRVSQVQLMMDKVTMKCRGFGFVTFEDEETVDKICKQRFVQINGKMVECKRAEFRNQNGPPTPGQPGGWGGGDMNQGSPQGGAGMFNQPQQQPGWNQGAYGAGQPAGFNQYNNFGNYGAGPQGGPPQAGQNPGGYGNGYNQGGQQQGYQQQGPQQPYGYGQQGQQGQPPQNNYGNPQQNYGYGQQGGYGQTPGPQGPQSNYNQQGGQQQPNQGYGQQQQNFGNPGAPGTQGNMGNYPQEASGYGPQRVNQGYNQGGYNQPQQAAGTTDQTAAGTTDQTGGNNFNPNMNNGGGYQQQQQQPPQQQQPQQQGNFGGAPNQGYGGNMGDPSQANYNRGGGPQPFHPYRR